MKAKLKASSKSSNFWVGLTTLGSALVTALVMTLSSDPEAIKTMTFTQVGMSLLMHLSNILYHMNKNTAVPSAQPDSPSDELILIHTNEQ